MVARPSGGAVGGHGRPRFPAGPSGSGATAPEPADAPDTQQDGTGTHDTHSAEVVTAEQGFGFAELPTEAPRTGPLSPLPAPLLTGLPPACPGCARTAGCCGDAGSRRPA